MIATEDPITCVEYAMENDLLNGKDEENLLGIKRNWIEWLSKLG